VNGREHLLLLIPGGQEKTTHMTAMVMRSPCEIDPSVLQQIHKSAMFESDCEQVWCCVFVFYPLYGLELVEV
jgi:hypothetical protein